MSTLSAGILLFLIMDPLGNIPLFLALLRNVEPRRRVWVLA
jgi:small neutral amino acid transporter SnatA (MarC family)